VLWTDGSRFLVRADSGLPPTLPGRLAGKALSADPLEQPFDPVASPPRPPTDFNALVDEIVGEVSSSAYFQWIERLAGAEPVVVGGEDVTFATRYTRASQCRTAEQYVFEQFQAMGFTDVEYDPFNLGGIQARNVIATLPGTETPDRIYILCGHLDSTSPIPYSSAPGANDNASGTAAVLAGADILKEYFFRSTIKFIAFTGEEQGLVGSEHYAAAAQAAGDSILAVVNCDMIAFFDTQYQIDIESAVFAEWLMLTLDDATTTYTTLGTDLLYNPWGSDHVPFLQRGFPAVLAIESDYYAYPCYHETCDTADQNDAAFGAEVTRACLATIAHLAGVYDPATDVVAVGPAVGDLVVQPNPFRSATDIVFAVTEPGRVTITVHDVRGALVRTLSDRLRSVGTHGQSWDGRSGGGTPMPAGVYFVTLRADRLDEVRKVVRLQ
jgi:hypothetical protein